MKTPNCRNSATLQQVESISATTPSTTPVATTPVFSTPVFQTMTGRECNQDTRGTWKAAANGPVFITDRGVPAHVLPSIEEYRGLTHTGKSLAELLTCRPGKGRASGLSKLFEAQIKNFLKSAPPGKRIEERMRDLLSATPPSAYRILCSFSDAS